MQGLENDFLDPNEVSEKLIELEVRSRSNNLRTDGLIENTNETWGDCKKKVQKVHSFFIRTSNILQSFNVLIFFVNLSLKCSYSCSYSFMF